MTIILCILINIVSILFGYILSKYIHTSHTHNNLSDSCPDRLLYKDISDLNMHDVLNIMGIGITISNKSGTILFANDEEIKQHGYTDPSDIIGKHVSIFAPPAHQQLEYYKNTLRVQNDIKKPYIRESVNIKKDGTTFPVEIISQPIYYKTGCTYRVSICRNISDDIEYRNTIQAEVTKRENSEKWLESINDDLTQQIHDKIQAEIILEKQRSQYKQLYQLVREMCDNTPLMIWAKDIHGKYIFANKATRDMLSHFLSIDTPIGKTDRDFTQNYENNLNAKKLDSIEKYIEQSIISDKYVMHTKTTYDTIEEIIFDGKPRYISFTKAPFLNHNNTIIGLVGSARDITNEEETKRAIEKTEHRLKITIEQSPIPLVVFSTSGNIIITSLSFSSQFDIPITTVDNFTQTIQQLNSIINDSDWIDLLHTTKNRIHIGQIPVKTIRGDRIWDWYAIEIGSETLLHPSDIMYNTTSQEEHRFILLAASDVTDITETLEENKQLKEAYKEMASQMTEFLQRVNDDEQHNIDTASTIVKIQDTDTEYIARQTGRFSITEKFSKN